MKVQEQILLDDQSGQDYTQDAAAEALKRMRRKRMLDRGVPLQAESSNDDSQLFPQGVR